VVGLRRNDEVPAGRMGEVDYAALQVARERLGLGHLTGKKRRGASLSG
jgi:hypothetical protein